ncbi:MAG: 3-deoxy-manno-octulosonate cytidylyltransferase [Planctomycetota bacterium]
MGAIALIPARLASSRFPRKVLASDTGRPLIAHVCECAAASTRVERVVVATDHESICEAVEAAGFVAIMTGPDHPNGTSRLAEAADRLELSDDQVVVNVQGDEPDLPAGPIDAVIDALGPGVSMATAAAPMRPGDTDNPNIVKVVLREDRRAMYFSRSRIPSEGPALRHAGLYAYRAGFLRTYARLSPTPLERAERLEQLRALEHGHDIAVAVLEFESIGIDTPEQYAAFVERSRASG